MSVTADVAGVSIGVTAYPTRGNGSLLTALKAAVGSMERAQAYEPALEPSARNFFYCTWPGWSFSRYDSLWHDYDDALVANILPFSSTPVGHLDQAELGPWQRSGATAYPRWPRRES